MRANLRAAASSLGSYPFSIMRSATSRYSSPVSMWANPSLLARLRASAPLPLAALPSMAITGRDVASSYRVLRLIGTDFLQLLVHADGNRRSSEPDAEAGALSWMAVRAARHGFS